MGRVLTTCCATAALLLSLFCFGCGHTRVCKVGLVSFGNLEGKAIPMDLDGPVLEGSDSAVMFGRFSYSLAEAARNALKNTDYDTLVDVEVTAQTGLFVPQNRLTVRGKALNSGKLGVSGEKP